MSKYTTLINILDELRKEAPSEYKRYYPIESNYEEMNKARARAYIHLFLKVKFGLLSFLEREKFITDDKDDGGVDGYFIDEENKKIYFIQSKFRTSENNFETKNIDLEDLLSMDLDRITKGEKTYTTGIRYNDKIINLIDRIQSIDDYAKYQEIVILLANLKEKYKQKIKPLTIFPAEIYDCSRCYEELVFPVITGNFYNPKELKITINVSNYGGSNRIDYYVDTEIKECNITVLFVPTKEIGKILFKYKNSILKYNPRSFLELAAGSVNENIKKSITELNKNDFALFNNGITMLSDNTFFKDRIGKRNEASLIITNPQIINGGQTAFTLSRIYEEQLEGQVPTDIFDNKEVLLKVITFDYDGCEDSQSNDQKLKLIEDISRATNNQTEVTEADRRSNEKVQLELQKNLFDEFGYFYERKKGEFGDGLRCRYIDRTCIIDRETFLRIVISVDGNPSQSRRASAKRIFKSEAFKSILKSPSLYKKYFFAYKAYIYLNQIQKGYDKQKNNPFGVAQFGNALRYGKWAVINVISDYYIEGEEINDYSEKSKDATNTVLKKWIEFENYAKKQSLNRPYFREIIDPDSGEKEFEINYDNYYKGSTVVSDLDKFFRKR